MSLSEAEAVLVEFEYMLRQVTGDGATKRAAGAKPPWWRDESHLPAVFSHLNKWYHGETVDPDSGAHPLVHAAWRLLAIAYQETNGQVDPHPELGTCESSAGRVPHGKDPFCRNWVAV